MTLDEICENARQLSRQHGWNHADSTRMLHITAEVGEVADALISLQAAPPEQIDVAKQALGHEIFDVIWNLCALANATGINLDQAARSKMAANDERTWPKQSI